MCALERKEGQNEMEKKKNMEERNERKGGRKEGDMSHTSVAVLKSKMKKNSTGQVDE